MVALGHPLRDPRGIPATLRSGLLTPRSVVALARWAGPAVLFPRRVVAGPDRPVREGLTRVGLRGPLRTEVLEPFLAGVLAEDGGDTSDAFVRLLVRMFALGASVVLQSSTGEREVPIGEFLVDTFQSSIAPNEILTEIRVTSPSTRSGGAYLKLERKVGDYATVAAAIYLELNNGSIGKAGIALTSVGLTNIKATAAEASLAGVTTRRCPLARAAVFLWCSRSAASRCCRIARPWSTVR